jgi:AraC-like DNA-binding protein
MPLQFAQPRRLLQPYVNAYVLYEQVTPAPRQNMIPLGSQFIFALLQGQVTFTHPCKPPYALPALSLLGQHTHAVSVQQVFPCRAAAIKFSPYGCHALFGVNMASIQDSYLDISYIDNRPTPLEDTSLIDRLRQAKNVVQIKLLFDEWLLQQPIREKQVRRVARIVEMIENNRGSLSIDHVLKQFSISERTLQRLFSKVVGLNPKLFIRIVRYNHVLTGLDGESNSLQDLIYRAGYFDQSHFIKDFLQFTHCNPSAFPHEESNQISIETIRGLLKQST